MFRRLIQTLDYDNIHYIPPVNNVINTNTNTNTNTNNTNNRNIINNNKSFVNNIIPSELQSINVNEIDTNIIVKPIFNEEINKNISHIYTEKKQSALELSLGFTDNNSIEKPIKQTEISNKIFIRNINPLLFLDTVNKGNTIKEENIKKTQNENNILEKNISQNQNKYTIDKQLTPLTITGTIRQSYEFCEDIPDTTPPPYNIICLQKLFTKLGGNIEGLFYPSQNNIHIYNTYTNLGKIKHSWGLLWENLKSLDKNVRGRAMLKLFGITPDRLLKRTPWTPGVEVLWFYGGGKREDGSEEWPGFLRRTIERDIPQISNGIIPQIDLAHNFSFISLMDVRAKSDFTIKYNIFTDNPFWCAINQPNEIDWYAVKHPIEDTIGFFSNNDIQNLSTHYSNNQVLLSSKSANIIKLYYHDTIGMGYHSFLFNSVSDNNDKNYMNNVYYSLTCEPRAPYINYEVSIEQMKLEDTRNPWAFSRFIYVSGAEYHTRHEEIINVPGNKGFIRLNNAESKCSINNIAFQAWGGCNLAFRLTTMPIKDALICLGSANNILNIVLKPISGSISEVSIQHNLTENGRMTVINTDIRLILNTWYYLLINQYSPNNIGIFIDTPFNIIIGMGNTANTVKINSHKPFYYKNGLYKGPRQLCYFSIGAKSILPSFASSGFNFDLAFIHFFDQSLNNDDWVREAKCDWIFTEPSC